mgnify:CR=1 FL=1
MKKIDFFVKFKTDLIRILESINSLAPLCSIYWLGFKEITCLQKEAASVLAQDQMMESIEKRKGSTKSKLSY